MTSLRIAHWRRGKFDNLRATGIPRPPSQHAKPPTARVHPRSNPTNTSTPTAPGAVRTDQQPRSHHADRTTLRLYGPAGYRDVAAADFFRGVFATDLADGEFLASLLVPHRLGRTGYHKLKLCEGGWPIVTAVVTDDPEREGAEVTVGAAQAVPVRVELTALLGGAGGLDRGGIDALFRQQIDDPWSDVLADGTYRRQVAGAVVRRAVADLFEGPNR